MAGKTRRGRPGYKARFVRYATEHILQKNKELKNIKHTKYMNNIAIKIKSNPIDQ